MGPKKARKTNQRLIDKIESPSVIYDTNKEIIEFSLFDDNKTDKNDECVDVSDTTDDKSNISNIMRPKISLLVKLKITRDEYEKFMSNNKKDEMNNEEIDKGIKMTELRDTDVRNKIIEMDNIYPKIEIEVEAEKIIFRNYSDININSLNEKMNDRHISNKKIHLMLSKFKGQPWPKTSSYACWNCSEYFKNSPVGIPNISSAQSDAYHDKYYLEGNFCSFECAVRHLFDSRSNSDSQLWTIYEMMNFMYNEIFPTKEYKKIKMAPERLCLRKYGGNLSLEEYYGNRNNNINFELFKSSLVPSLYHIQETCFDLGKILGASKMLPNYKSKQLIQPYS